MSSPIASTNSTSMHRTLLWKEFRETWWLAGLLLAIWQCPLLERMGFSFEPGTFRFGYQLVSVSNLFVSSRIVESASLSGLVTGSLLGLLQTLAEDWRGTWPFLLHRPAKRSVILRCKFALGLTLSLLATYIPLLVYYLWANWFGWHTAPFYWWMTGPAVLAALVVIPAYCAAVASGLSSSRWYGTKFLPLSGVIFLNFYALNWSAAVQLGCFAFTTILACLAIFDAARRRDWV